MAEKKGDTVDATGWSPQVCTIKKRLDGKLAVVTGANTGIGLATTAELARRGCTVIMACRSMERAKTGRDSIISKYGQANPNSLKTDIADESMISTLSPIQPDQLILEHLDLESLKSVRQFAERILKAYPKINYLINNAGLILNDYEISADGFEKTIGINHLGPFLLTELLLPALKRGAPSRIIDLASLAHTFGSLRKPDLHIPKAEYDAFVAYCQSKLANVMHARELSKRLTGTGVVVASVHPGVVASDFQRNFNTEMLALHAYYKPLEINTWQGAQTTLYAVLVDPLIPGAYYDNCALATPIPAALDDADCKWLWEKSCELVGLKC